jgi:hypothetical protein
MMLRVEPSTVVSSLRDEEGALLPSHKFRFSPVGKGKEIQL